MGTANWNFFLNAENYGPILSSAEQFSKVLEENGTIIDRITKITDLDLRLPQVEENSTSNAELASQVKSEEKEDSDSQIINDADPLRAFLVNNLNIEAIKIQPEDFDGVRGERVKQLLCDIHRLGRLRDAKRAVNAEILKTYKTYEKLLRDVVLPQLTRDVAAQNIARISRARQLCTLNTFPASKELWERYVRYVGVLENVKQLTRRLTALLEREGVSQELERMETQLEIVENLQTHVRSLTVGD